ncbi:leucine aminopeptidase [Clonorchis sinensis]|uniref:Leucine aminopeptidase n=1 Tax=Clonorchis sinensis TaxID=79923 RepID=G7YH85_CLOSI|nr:leucine aminopeptidase [Clonorchis sinensis]
MSTVPVASDPNHHTGVSDAPYRLNARCTDNGCSTRQANSFSDEQIGNSIEAMNETGIRSVIPVSFRTVWPVNRKIYWGVLLHVKQYNLLKLYVNGKIRFDLESGDVLIGGDGFQILPFSNQLEKNQLYPYYPSDKPDKSMQFGLKRGWKLRTNKRAEGQASMGLRYWWTTDSLWFPSPPGEFATGYNPFVPAAIDMDLTVYQPCALRVNFITCKTCAQLNSSGFRRQKYFIFVIISLGNDTAIWPQDCEKIETNVLSSPPFATSNKHLHPRGRFTKIRIYAGCRKLFDSPRPVSSFEGLIRPVGDGKSSTSNAAMKFSEQCSSCGKVQKLKSKFYFHISTLSDMPVKNYTNHQKTHRSLNIGAQLSVGTNFVQKPCQVTALNCSPDTYENAKVVSIAPNYVERCCACEDTDGSKRERMCACFIMEHIKAELNNVVLTKTGPLAVVDRGSNNSNLEKQFVSVNFSNAFIHCHATKASAECRRKPPYHCPTHSTGIETVTNLIRTWVYSINILSVPDFALNPTKVVDPGMQSVPFRTHQPDVTGFGHSASVSLKVHWPPDHLPCKTSLQSLYHKYAVLTAGSDDDDDRLIIKLTTV